MKLYNQVIMPFQDSSSALSVEFLLCFMAQPKHTLYTPNSNLPISAIFQPFHYAKSSIDILQDKNFDKAIAYTGTSWCLLALIYFTFCTWTGLLWKKCFIMLLLLAENCTSQIPQSHHICLMKGSFYYYKPFIMM